MPGRQTTAGNECPVWRVNSNIANPTPVLVGRIPAPTDRAAPLTFAPHWVSPLIGRKAVRHETDRIYSFTPDASAPPIATVFASGVPGTNGVAFDVDGNLWTSDGVTGVGRVWKIGPSGGVCESSFTGCEEVFRVQPMANVVNLDQNNVGGVGARRSHFAAGAITVLPFNRNAQASRLPAAGGEQAGVRQARWPLRLRHGAWGDLAG